MADILISALAILLIFMLFGFLLGLINIAGSALNQLLQLCFGSKRPSTPEPKCCRCNCQCADRNKYDRCHGAADADDAGKEEEDTADRSRYQKPRRYLP